MGKSINPADQHRREQRKKDLKKAKTARMKVRNEKLVSEPVRVHLLDICSYTYSRL